MGKLTDILIATAGIYEILTYRENQPTVFDRALEKCAKLYHAGVGMYRIVIPEPPREPVRPFVQKETRPDAEYYRKKMDDIHARMQH